MKKFEIDQKYDEEFDISPCCTVAFNDKCVKPDEIVAPYKEITIKFDYPLRKEAKFSFSTKNENGFTRAKFLSCIRKGYKKIYAAEDKACGKTDNIPGMLNRDSSDGPYGIWGHHIEDLVIEGVRESSKPGVFLLDIGS